MQIWKKRLSVILLLQLLLAGALWALSYREEAAGSLTEPLFSFKAEAVSRIEMGEGDNTVKLSREEGGWILPEFYSLRADAKKVESLLEDLQTLQVANPETTSASSHDRLGVGEEQPQARVRLYAQDEELGELLFGKTPTFGRRYVRRRGQNDTYRVESQGLQLRATDKAWLERDLLALKSPQKVVFPDFELDRVEGEWRIGDEVLEQKKADELVERLRSLSVLDATEKTKPDGATEIRVDQDGTTYVYTFFQDSGDHFVVRNDREIAFQIPPEAALKLVEAKASDLRPNENSDAEAKE